MRNVLWKVDQPLVRLLVAVMTLFLLTGCGDDDQVVATRPDGRTIVQVSPESDQRVEQGVEGAQITIENGGFDVETVIGQAQEPNVLTIVNQDDVAYRFGIEQLLQPVPVAANGAETRVEFTTPSEGGYEGRLYAAEGDDVLATIHIQVQAPGGI